MKKKIPNQTTLYYVVKAFEQKNNGFNTLEYFFGPLCHACTRLHPIWMQYIANLHVYFIAYKIETLIKMETLSLLWASHWS